MIVRDGRQENLVAPARDDHLKEHYIFDGSIPRVPWDIGDGVDHLLALDHLPEDAVSPVHIIERGITESQKKRRFYRRASLTLWAKLKSKINLQSSMVQTS